MNASSENRCVLAWVHISDIHLEQGSSSWKYDQQLVLRALQKDIATPVSRGAPQPDVILCTGDVAATGALVTAEEYEKARGWLEALQSRTDASAFFFVPGNHDVQRTPSKPQGPFRLIGRVRRGEEAIDEAYTDAGDDTILAARFANYTAFVASMGAPSSSHPGGVWSETVGGRGYDVRLVGINTSVVSNDDHDRHYLYIGLGQLAAVFGAIPNAIPANEITVVLGHHPVDWLPDEDRNRLEAYLYQEADIYLHGHIHSAASRRSVSGIGSELVTVSAGAVHGDPPGSQATTHGYSLNGIFETDEGGLVLRVWPRQWDDSNKRFVLGVGSLAEGEEFAEHPLKSRQPPPPKVVGPPQKAAPAQSLLILSTALLSRWGSRRTAFPTDMSIAELDARGLIVSTRVRAAGRTLSTQDLASFVTEGVEPTHLLVLGDPGSGKSVLLFQLGRLLLEKGYAPLPLNIAGLEEANTSSLDSLTQVLAGEPVDLDGSSVLLLDGVDEALAAGRSAQAIAKQISELASFASIVVSCRSLEYEMELASVISPDLFDAIGRIEPWGPEEFSTFVKELAAQDLLPDLSLLELVSQREELERLTHRPLLARMLTYVAGQEAALPEDAVSLYQQYIGKLSQTTNAAMNRLGGAEPSDASRIWREIAWRAFRSPAIRPDSIPLDTIVGALRERAPDTYRDYRALAGIVDVSSATTPPTGAFVHYSFYEFLVAQQATFELTQAFTENRPDRAAQALNQDFPKEIRRHLTALLRVTAAQLDPMAWPDWLARVYRAPSGSQAQQQTVRNLVAYIACRLSVPANEALWDLLQDEQDPFLQNSLLWALTRGDDRRALVRYLTDLETSEELASLNRGYLLYYFGDIRGDTPPFRDDAPYVDWGHTREVLRANFASQETYEKTPPSRKLIDLYTFFDMAAVRGDRLTSEEEESIGRIHLSLEELPAEALDILARKAETVRPE